MLLEQKYLNIIFFCDFNYFFYIFFLKKKKKKNKTVDQKKKNEKKKNEKKKNNNLHYHSFSKGFGFCFFCQSSSSS